MVVAERVFLCDSQTWTPHYFVLTSNKIYYSEETSHYQTAEEEEEEDEGREVGQTVMFNKGRSEVLLGGGAMTLNCPIWSGV